MSKEQFNLWLGDYRGGAVVGQIVSFVGVGCPSKWLICDGSIVLISSYQQLFTLLGNAYGGDGVTTFALPDLRNRVPVGASNNINTVGGSSQISIIKDNLPNVTLSLQGSTSNNSTGVTAQSIDSGHSHKTYAVPNRGYDCLNGGTQWTANAETEITSSISYALITTTITDPQHSHTLAGSTEALGLATPITIQPPYATVNYIIYTGVF